MQQFGASVFNTVVRWHNLGEVDNECRQTNTLYTRLDLKL